MHSRVIVNGYAAVKNAIVVSTPQEDTPRTGNDCVVDEGVLKGVENVDFINPARWQHATNRTLNWRVSKL